MSAFLHPFLFMALLVCFLGCGADTGTTKLNEMPTGTPASTDPADDPNVAAGPDVPPPPAPGVTP